MVRVHEMEEQMRLKDEKTKDFEAALFLIFNDILDVNELCIS